MSQFLVYPLVWTAIKKKTKSKQLERIVRHERTLVASARRSGNWLPIHQQPIWRLQSQFVIDLPLVAASAESWLNTTCTGSWSQVEVTRRYFVRWPQFKIEVCLVNSNTTALPLSRPPLVRSAFSGQCIICFSLALRCPPQTTSLWTSFVLLFLSFPFLFFLYFFSFLFVFLLSF